MAHAAPPAPQRETDGATHVAPSQQPLVHEVGSQTHIPERQCCPEPQAAPPPQAQTPVAEQPSALATSQPMHVAPPTPQVATEGALQVAPEQHPPGQLAAVQPLQRPASQVCPAGQVSQRLPPAPHDASESPARQAPSEQQPSGQDVPSQTQVLPMQRCPAAQAGAVPHRQSPIDEQLSARASHTAHVAPPVPQVASDRVVQVAPTQQPLGQDAESQVHSPAAHRCPPAQAGPAPQAQLPSALH